MDNEGRGRRGSRGPAGRRGTIGQADENIPPAPSTPVRRSSTSGNSMDSGAGPSGPARQTTPTVAHPVAQPIPIPMIDPLAGLVEPDENERRAYFTGLPGEFGWPRLVARTGSTVFEYDPNWRQGVIQKEYSTIGEHPCIPLWTRSVSRQIFHALEASSLKWDVYFPIRIGELPETSPVVLLVGLHHDTSRTWQQAMRVALQLRAILQQHRLTGVEVEMMESHAKPSASEASRELADSVDWKYSQPIGNSEHSEHDIPLSSLNGVLQRFYPLPGHAITQSDIEPASSSGSGAASTKRGTMGLFVRLVDPSGQTAPKTCGVTSRHVAVGDRRPHGQDVKQVQNGMQDLVIFSNPNTSRMGIAGAFRNVRPIVKRASGKTEKALSDPDLNPDKADVVADLFAMQMSAPAYIMDLQAILQRYESAPPEKRRIGPVVASPHHHVGRHGQWVDWALVGTPNTTTTLENKVHMRSSATESAMDKANGLKDDTPQYNRLVYEDIITSGRLDNDGFLRVHSDGMPAEPSFVPNNQGRRQSHVVVMSGAMSGTTFGVTNEIEAVRRSPFGGTNDNIVAFHLVVVGLGGGTFSRPGDSGACIFDTTGQVVGIVDAGLPFEDLRRYMIKYQPGQSSRSSLPAADNEPRQSPLPPGFAAMNSEAILGIVDRDAPVGSLTDVTFVTPIQWVLEDMRRFTGRKPEVI